MAGSVNKVILIGAVAADPDVRDLNGKQVASIKLATTESWRDKATGEKKERTEWHRVVVFNDHLVKVISQYVKKGAKLYVEGQLQTRKWTDKQTGQDKFSTEVVLQAFNGHMTMLDAPRREGQDQGRGNVRQQYQDSQAPREPKSYPRDPNDDVPF